MKPFEIVPPKRRRTTITKSVLYRFNDESLQTVFNKALNESGLSAQKLMDQMVRHCLISSGRMKEPVRERSKP